MGHMKHLFCWQKPYLEFSAAGRNKSFPNCCCDFCQQTGPDSSVTAAEPAAGSAYLLHSDPGVFHLGRKPGGSTGTRGRLLGGCQLHPTTLPLLWVRFPLAQLVSVVGSPWLCPPWIGLSPRVLQYRAPDMQGVWGTPALPEHPSCPRAGGLIPLNLAGLGLCGAGRSCLGAALLPAAIICFEKAAPDAGSFQLGPGR